MRRTGVGLLLSAWVLATPALSRASGWVQPVGGCYGKLYQRSWFGDRAYTAESLHDNQAVPDFQDHLVNVYAECGLHPWVTVTTALAPAGYAKSGDRGTFYVGPLSAGARIGLVRDGPLRLAIAARYGYAPAVGDEVLSASTFAKSDGSEGAAIYQPTVETHFGELSVGLGRSFALGRWPAYLAAALGARLSSADSIDPVLLAELKVGATFWERLALDLHFSTYEPFFQPVELTNTSGAGQTRYLGFGLTISYWFIRRLAVFFNLDGVFYAESAAAAPSLAFGLETRIDFVGRR